MDRRQKDIVTMAEHADLAVVSCEKKNGRQFATVLAENKVTRTFSISLGSRSDPRGDLNELGAMKRFARENRLQSPPEPSTTTSTKPPVSDMTTATPRKTITAPTRAATSASKTAVQTLSHVDFYRACEWVKGQVLSTVPSLEALAMLAGQHLGSAVPEDEMKTVMEIVGISEPAHWAEPTDPRAILARELLTIMKKLGEEPSQAFKQLATSLLPTTTA